MSKNDLLISIRRTLVPIVVGVVGGSFLAPFVNLDELSSVVSGVVSGLYYTILRVAEAKHPAVGVLLGAQRQPTYQEPVG